MKTESFTKKYITKPMVGALTLGMLYSPFAAKDANADSYLKFNRDINEKRVELGLTFSHDLLGGNSAKYNSRNGNLESRTVGLAEIPKISGESSQAYFEKYDGNVVTKPLKEFAHGATSVVHPYNTKTDGTKRILPGISTLDKEGSIFAPVTGLVAYAVNGISKLFGGDDLMYNAWKQNGWRTAGTATLEIVAAIAAANSGGGSSGSTTTTEVVADSDEDGGDIIGPGGYGK